MDTTKTRTISRLKVSLSYTILFSSDMNHFPTCNKTGIQLYVVKRRNKISILKDEWYRSRRHSKEEKKRQKREWKKRLQEERKRKRRNAKKGKPAEIDMPDVRQNEIDGACDDDLECGNS